MAAFVAEAALVESAANGRSSRHAVPVESSGSHVLGALHVTLPSARALALTTSRPKRQSVVSSSPNEANPRPRTTTVVPPCAGPPRGETPWKAIE